MKGLKEAYTILEQMVDNAKSGYRDKVLQLNRQFEDVIAKNFKSPSTDPDYVAYDGCRQSCVFSVLLPNMHEQYLRDAKERFEKIPEP